MITNANKLADRRKGYDDQRVIALKAIDGLKAKPAVAGQIPVMNKLVEQCRQSRRSDDHAPEDGVRELKDTENGCNALLKAAPEAEAYTAERKTPMRRWRRCRSMRRSGVWAKYCRRFSNSSIWRRSWRAMPVSRAGSTPERRITNRPSGAGASHGGLNNAAKTCRPGERPSDTASGAGKMRMRQEGDRQIAQTGRAIAKGEHADQVKG